MEAILIGAIVMCGICCVMNIAKDKWVRENERVRDWLYKR